MLFYRDDQNDVVILEKGSDLQRFSDNADEGLKIFACLKSRFKSTVYY